MIESFRNGLWPGYKTGEGSETAMLFKKLATPRSDVNLFRDVDSCDGRAPHNPSQPGLKRLMLATGASEDR